MNDFDEQNNEKVLEDKVEESVVEEDVNSQENAENVEKTDKKNDENERGYCGKRIGCVFCNVVLSFRPRSVYHDAFQQL